MTSLYITNTEEAMATIFEQENQRTPITYKTCEKLGMKYMDTLDPQYIYQVKSIDRPVLGGITHIRVIFRLLTDGVEVSYTLDDWQGEARTWIDLPNPCEEELAVLVEAVRQKFETE